MVAGAGSGPAWDCAPRHRRPAPRLLATTFEHDQKTQVTSLDGDSWSGDDTHGAFNATAAARAAAHVSADGGDLRDVLPLLVAWLKAMP